MKEGRSNFAAVSLPDRPSILALGGLSGAGRRNLGSSSVERLEPQRLAWLPAPPLPQPLSRHRAAFLPFAQCLVVSGGRHGSAATSDCCLWDLRTDCWQPGPPMRLPRAQHGLALLGDKLYAFGGESSKRTVETLELRANSWLLQDSQLRLPFASGAVARLESSHTT